MYFLHGTVFIPPHYLRAGVVGILGGLLLAGCGQKGPLYLEGHEPPAERRAKERAARVEREAQSQEQAQTQPQSQAQTKPQATDTAPDAVGDGGMANP